MLFWRCRLNSLIGCSDSLRAGPVGRVMYSMNFDCTLHVRYVQGDSINECVSVYKTYSG